MSVYLLQSKIVRVLNLWQKNGVFKIEVIQPLLDMAAGTSSTTAPYSGTDEPGNWIVSSGLMQPYLLLTKIDLLMILETLMNDKKKIL